MQEKYNSRSAYRRSIYPRLFSWTIYLVRSFAQLFAWLAVYKPTDRRAQLSIWLAAQQQFILVRYGHFGDTISVREI